MNLYRVEWIEVYEDKTESLRSRTVEAFSESEACEKVDALNKYPANIDSVDLMTAEFIKRLPCESHAFDASCEACQTENDKEAA